MTATTRLQVGQTLTGPLFNEPMRVETVSASGDLSWVLGLVGTQTERFRHPSVPAELLSVGITDARKPYRQITFGV
jgi:hypothetical protein